MQAYDIIMLVILLLATFIGYRKGFAWQVASVASIFASYIVAVRFRDQVAAQIRTEPPWNVFLAMLLLYVGTSLTIWLGFQLIHGFIDRAKLKDFDRQLGALLGLAKGALLCVVVTIFSTTLLGGELRDEILHSTSGRQIAKLLDKAHGLLPDEVHQVLHPYFHKLENEIQHADQPTTDGPIDRFEEMRRWLDDAQQELAWPEQGTGSQRENTRAADERAPWPQERPEVKPPRAARRLEGDPFYRGPVGAADDQTDVQTPEPPGGRFRFDR